MSTHVEVHIILTGNLFCRLWYNFPHGYIVLSQKKSQGQEVSFYSLIPFEFKFWITFARVFPTPATKSEGGPCTSILDHSFSQEKESGEWTYRQISSSCLVTSMIWSSSNLELPIRPDNWSIFHCICLLWFSSSTCSFTILSMLGRFFTSSFMIFLLKLARPRLPRVRSLTDNLRVWPWAWQSPKDILASPAPREL